jgi:hypothetical protein
MVSIFRRFIMIGLFAIAFMGVLQSPALGIQMTIDAIDDAGQSPNEEAYLKFVYASGYHVVNASGPQWTFASQVYAYASDPTNNIPQNEEWELQSAGNIWSSDKIVGEALNNLSAGLYRVSVVGGAFMYDSFDEGWSPFENQWRWELHIQALRAFVGGEIKDYFDYMLGSFDHFDTAALALQASIGMHIDIALAEGGSLIFWIWDNPNTIDNSGSLTFDVATAPIPEPSTLILTGTGLFFLARRFRRSNNNLLIS